MSATLAARAHTNATLSAPPVRRSKPARRNRVSWLGQLWRAALRRPGRSLVLFLFACATTVIMMNALVFQKVRHPAPIAAVPAPVAPPVRPADLRIEQVLRSELPATEPAPAAPAVTAPAATPRPPARPQTAAREAAPRPPSPVASNAAPRPAAQPAPAPAPVARSTPPRDPIADLINGDMRPPGEIRGVASAKPATPRRSAEN